MEDHHHTTQITQTIMLIGVSLDSLVDPGGIITNIWPTKSLRLILGLISEINLVKINLLD